jgi:hypothetical protein
VDTSNEKRNQFNAREAEIRVSDSNFFRGETGYRGDGTEAIFCVPLPARNSNLN